MPRYFNEKISKEELATKIYSAMKKHEDFEADEEPESNIEGVIQHSEVPYTDITKQVEKDLAKVDFGTENLEIESTGVGGNYKVLKDMSVSILLRMV